MTRSPYAVLRARFLPLKALTKNFCFFGDMEENSSWGFQKVDQNPCLGCMVGPCALASSSEAKIWGLLFLNLTMLFRVSGLVSGLFTTFMK